MSLTTDNLKKFANMAELTSKLAGKTQEFFNIDDSNLKRSMTNFDRSVASRAFDRTNQSLKDSHNIRMTQSGFFPGRSTNSKEFNMALRIIKEWIRDKGYNSS
jgi:hypothetical protein